MGWGPLLATIASGVLLAGCGGTTRSGRVLFAQDCSACHTISGVDSPARMGGDLRAVHLSRRILLQFMSEMPVHPHPSGAELGRIADYVLAVQRRRR